MVQRFLLATALIGVLVGSGAATRADVITWTTGDLGNNVILSGGSYTVNPDLISPSNLDPATLVVKYGLWNSPDVPVNVSFNGTLVGSFTADQGYIFPGPEYASFDVTGLLLPGLNTVLFEGSGSGDYVIGQVDVTYHSVNVVPEPSTFAIAGVSILAGLAAWRRRRS